MSKIYTGIDRMIQDPGLLDKSARWGLVSNDASITKEKIPVRMALRANQFNLICLFSPEHGIHTKGIDGDQMPDQKDSLTGLPVYSLYGDNLAPKLELLNNLDGILFDLPDIGLRFYTYIWTLSYVLEACNQSGMPMILLDRPNPQSGDMHKVEGPILDEKNLSSFIGRWSIPIRHSMTIGELAKYWVFEKKLNNFSLRVIEVSGWKRSYYFHEGDQPFVPPSPAITKIKSIYTYAALCFLESTNVSEARGSDHSFEIAIAPWIDGNDLAIAMNNYHLAGIEFIPMHFIPKLSGKYAGIICHGIQLNITNQNLFKPIKTGLILLATLKRMYPLDFKWNPYPTHVNPGGHHHLDLLTGTKLIKEYIDHDPEYLIQNIDAITEAKDWEDKVKPFLIY